MLETSFFYFKAFVYNWILSYYRLEKDTLYFSYNSNLDKIKSLSNNNTLVDKDKDKDNNKDEDDNKDKDDNKDNNNNIVLPPPKRRRIKYNKKQKERVEVRKTVDNTII